MRCCTPWSAGAKRRPGVRRARYGYSKWTVSLEEALADPAIDIVIIGSPSEQHEAQAIQCLEAGKHTLIEIPDRDEPGRRRARGRRRRARAGKVYGLCHPMRFRREREALRARVRGGRGEDPRTSPGGSSSSGW